MNFAFVGTPEFAGWVLSGLTQLDRRPTAVVSSGDRARGRGRKPAAPPAVVEAKRIGLECLQTEEINDPAVSERLKTSGVTVLVVAAFGQILAREILESFTCLNVHASLVPAYRGAAPIERALVAGESCTGVSIMRMVERLDEGPWALQTSVSVSRRDDAGSLGRLLALAGAVGIDQVLTALEDGTIVWTEQQGTASYAAKLGPADTLLDLRKGAASVHDQVRALSPAIGASTASGEFAFKVWRTWPYGQVGLEPVPAEAARVAGHSGGVEVAGDRLFVGCAEGVIEILALQPVGKNRMQTADFLRGYRARLGPWLDSLRARDSGQLPLSEG